MEHTVTQRFICEIFKIAVRIRHTKDVTHKLPSPLLSKERCQRPTRKDKLDLACFLGDAITSGWCNEANFYTTNHPKPALMSACRNHYSTSTYKPTTYRHYFHGLRSGLM
jgi:hypothetical protein